MIMATVQVNIRIDEKLKEEAEKLFDALGMNMTTAITAFISQTVREGGIPFKITTRIDPFFGEENMEILRKSIQAVKEGKTTAHELIEE